MRNGLAESARCWKMVQVQDRVICLRDFHISFHTYTYTEEGGGVCVQACECVLLCLSQHLVLTKKQTIKLYSIFKIFMLCKLYKP